MFTFILHALKYLQLNILPPSDVMSAKIAQVLSIVSALSCINATVGPMIKLVPTTVEPEILIPDFEMESEPIIYDETMVPFEFRLDQINGLDLEPNFELDFEVEDYKPEPFGNTPVLPLNLSEKILEQDKTPEPIKEILIEEFYTEPYPDSVLDVPTSTEPSTSTSSKPLSEPCRSKICDKWASYLSGPMNISIDPCHDFEGFVCGNWPNLFETPQFIASWGILEQQQYLIHKISALLLRTSEDEDWDLFLTAKKAFQSCMDLDSIERNGYKLWKEEVEDAINGFPMAEDFWRQGVFDPNVMIAKTLRLVGSNPLMNIRVEDRVNLTSKIHIDLAELSLPLSVLNDHEMNLHTFGAYVRLMYNVARQLHKDEEKYEERKLESDFGEGLATSEDVKQEPEPNLGSERIYSLPILPNAKRLISNGSVLQKEEEPLFENEAQRRKRGIFDLLPRVDEKTASTMEFQMIAEQVQNLAEFKIDLGKMKTIFDSPNEEIPFSRLKSLSMDDDTPLKTFMPHYLGKHQFKYTKIDFEILLRNVFQDIEGFDPHDYVYVVNSKQIDAIQKVYSHHDRKTIANLIGFHTFLQAVEHMPEVYRTMHANFKRVSLGLEQEMDRDATCGKMIVDHLPLVIAHLMYNKGADRRQSWALAKMESVIHSYLHDHGIQTESNKFPDWLMHRDAVDEFYMGIKSSEIEMGNHLKNWVYLSTWNSKRELQKLNSKRFGTDWSAKKLLSISDLATVPIDLFPNFLLKHPLIDYRAPNYANLAGLGWIVLQREIDQSPNGVANNTQENIIGHMLDTLKEFPSMHSEEALPGFEAFTNSQMLLMWFGRVWGCGGTRATPPFLTDGQAWRFQMFEDLEHHVHEQFYCTRH